VPHKALAVAQVDCGGQADRPSPIFMKINFKLPDDNQYHQFCPNCYSEQINRCFKNNKTFYKCDKCNGTFPRLIVIDPKIKWWIDKNTKEY